jgi:hypothetical protein
MLRLRYKKAISRFLRTWINDLRQYPAVDEWWSKLDEATQRKLMDRWQQKAESYLEYPDERQIPQ